MSTKTLGEFEDSPTDDEPTCNNGHVFCPGANGENAAHTRDDALVCFDCHCEA
jgi:hypothetical protein